MHRQRSLQILKMLKKAHKMNWDQNILNTALDDLLSAIGKNSAILQKRSETTRNEIKAFIGSSPNVS